MLQKDELLKSHLLNLLCSSFKVRAILQMLSLMLCIAFAAEVTIRHPLQRHENTTTPSVEQELDTLFVGPRNAFVEYTFYSILAFLMVDVQLRFFSSPCKESIFRA